MVFGPNLFSVRIVVQPSNSTNFTVTVDFSINFLEAIRYQSYSTRLSMLQELFRLQLFLYIRFSEQQFCRSCLFFELMKSISWPYRKFTVSCRNILRKEIHSLDIDIYNFSPEFANLMNMLTFHLKKPKCSSGHLECSFDNHANFFWFQFEDTSKVFNFPKKRWKHSSGHVETSFKNTIFSDNVLTVPKTNFFAP